MMNNPLLRCLCCCFIRKEDKEEVEKINKDKKHLEEILDLERLLKTLRKLSFFQELVLKRLEIEPDSYKWNPFYNVKATLKKLQSMQKLKLLGAQTSRNNRKQEETISIIDQGEN